MWYLNYMWYGYLRPCCSTSTNNKLALCGTNEPYWSVPSYHRAKLPSMHTWNYYGHDRTKLSSTTYVTSSSDYGMHSVPLNNLCC